MKHLFLGLLLSGCATPDWELKYAPVPVKHIVHVDFPCTYRTALACWNPLSQTIELRKGLSADDEQCALGHERKHAAGYIHSDRIIFTRTCG